MQKRLMAGLMSVLFVVSGLCFTVAHANTDDVVTGVATGDDVRGTNGTHRALLVGIDKYDPAYVGVNPLSSCINDVMGVRNMVLLSDPARRWSASMIQTLTNNLATAGAIRAGLQSLAAASSPGDFVLYAHSSHGGQYSGTSVYLCAYDQDYSAVSLGQDLALFNSGVTVVVLVDACHSGGLFRQGNGWPFAAMAMQSFKESKSQQYRRKGLAVPKDLGNNIAFMTACDYSQTSQSSAPFSLYIGAVITGCLDPEVDTNRDGRYQFSELHAYAARIATQNNPNQTAQQFNQAVLAQTVVRNVGSGVGPVIMANGMTNHIAISQSDNLVVTVQLIPRQYADTAVDWWGLALVNGSSWYYLNSPYDWQPFDGNLSNCRPAHQGVLFNLPATLVSQMVAPLPIGLHTLWFAVSYPMTPDGILNPSSEIRYDKVTVDVR